MNPPLPLVIENALQNAWDVLERSGEIGDRPRESGELLLDIVINLAKRGEHRQLVLVNRAIDEYRKHPQACRVIPMRTK